MRHPGDTFSPFLLSTALVSLALASGPFAAGAQQQPPADPTRFHIYVLAGQSNMAGRGVVEAQDSVIHPRVWMLNREMVWVPAVDPMHFDKPIAGVGPGRSFGIAMAEVDPSVHIGLVPTAVGGSAITSWVPGGIHQETGAYPWDEAITRAGSALRTGTLKGILWHQGESDSGNAASLAYADRMRSLIADFRRELNAPDTPFLIGQLGRWEASPWTPGRVRVDSIHQALATELPGVAFVSAEGLADNGDALHFNNVAARELGRRFAEEYRGLLVRRATAVSPSPRASSASSPQP